MSCGLLWERMTCFEKAGYCNGKSDQKKKSKTNWNRQHTPSKKKANSNKAPIVQLTAGGRRQYELIEDQLWCDQFVVQLLVVCRRPKPSTSLMMGTWSQRSMSHSSYLLSVNNYCVLVHICIVSLYFSTNCAPSCNNHDALPT
jgi:hypothetical protein